MHSMQEDAAHDLPSDAPVAAYLDKLPEPVRTEVMGEVLAVEAKAVQQVSEHTALCTWTYSTE